MKLLDHSFDEPALNLACDEALLEIAEADKTSEFLRFWESPSYFVVVGYGNSPAREADLAACARDDVKTLRRCSGGGTVVQGPGCLNYTLILQIARLPALETVTSTNQHIMQAHAAALSDLLKTKVSVRGTTDLAIGDVKFSGNAQRRKRDALLFHGTFLLRFDLEYVQRYLQMPSREPDYRAGRAHTEFVRNINIDATKIKTALIQRWGASETAKPLSEHDFPALAARYRDPVYHSRM